MQEAAPPAGSLRAEPSTLAFSRLASRLIAPRDLLPQQGCEGGLGLAAISVEIEAQLTLGADPPPLAEQGGAAEEIVLEAQPVEAPAIGCRHDVLQLGRLGEEGQRLQGAKRGWVGRFGHVYPISVTGRATRYQGKEARRAVLPGSGAAQAVPPVTLLSIVQQAAENEQYFQTRRLLI